VPADVLAEKLELAALVEQTSGVQAPGRFEDALLLAQAIGETRQHRGADGGARSECRKVESERFQGRGAADPARG
jgi:hypothetical protein